MRNFIRKSVVSLLLGFMLFSLMGEAVTLANNYTDRDFSFTFSSGNLRYTEGQRKLDSSKMYMKCTAITDETSYTAYAMGCRQTITGNYYDCSRGYTYLFDHAGDYHYMTSWVYEDGYGYGAIAASPNYLRQFSASGVWSPDNINQY